MKEINVTITEVKAKYISKRAESKIFSLGIIE